MNAIKKMILTWLWKIGYKAGKAMASFGDNIFSDAVMQGVKTHIETQTSFSTDSLESTLQVLSDDWAAGIVDEANGTPMLSDMTGQDMMDTFVGMFADETAGMSGDGTASYDAAFALFSNHANWTFVHGHAGVEFIATDDGSMFTINPADGTLVDGDDK